LREELGVDARIGTEVYRTHHQYAEMSEPIELLSSQPAPTPRKYRIACSSRFNGARRTRFPSWIFFRPTAN
jgi:hypothetical protein